MTKNDFPLDSQDNQIDITDLATDPKAERDRERYLAAERERNKQRGR